MKKWVAGFIIVLVLMFASVYVFIPKTIGLNAEIAVRATRAGLYRMLLDKDNVAKWWPGKISNDSFLLHDFVYKFHKDNITIIPVSISGPTADLTSSLLLIPIITDSVQLKWVGSIVAPYNPLKRFNYYLEAKKISRDMAEILQRMESFYSAPENIYGIEIKHGLVVDSLLIATSGISQGHPSNQFIYGLVEKLRTYARIHSAKETGYPMLNIGVAGSESFEVKVAIAIDRLLPSSGDILQKRMLGRGDILITEVKGGLATTTEAFKQMRHYADDYQFIAPAIPFYSLITDRSKEPDSSKWITKIYFPVR